jgi:hypothetical protein
MMHEANGGMAKATSRSTGTPAATMPCWPGSGQNRRNIVG